MASQRGSMGNAFGGGRESSFASLCQVDGIGELQVLAQSGQLSARGLESLQAGVLGRLNGSAGLGLPGLNPSGILQFASLPGLGSNNSIGRAQGIAPVNNPGNPFPCLSTGLELDQLQQKTQIARLGDIGAPVDDPVGFRTIQRQLTAPNSLPVGLGGSSGGNISVNSTNNALVLQLMQQQKQKHGRGLTTLTTERNVTQRSGASDINMVISSPLPNTNGNNGNWGNGAAVSGLTTNARSVGGTLSSASSGVQNLRESLLSASNVDCMPMDISVPPVNSLGPSSHSLIPRKDISLSSVSAMNNGTGNIGEVVPSDNRRPKLPILGNMNAGLRHGMNQIIKKDWKNHNQDFETISNPLLNTQLSRASLFNQKIVGTYVAQPQGQNTGFCDQKMNLDFKLPVNSVVPRFGGRCESEQSTADSQMKLKEGYPIDHVKMENGFLSENCNSTDELMNIFFKQVQDALHRATVDSNSEVGTIFQVLHTKESPPTYFRTNKFTTAFQEIVDAYGVAKYQEANPGIFTIVTFPFLFAVRFGDWGHGICLLLASLWLIFREKKLGSQKIGDIMEMAFGGRYVILMMSIFSIYCGLVYNEFFSVPFNIFGPSAYECRDASCSYSCNKSVFSRYLREVPTTSHVCNWDYSIRTSNWNGIKTEASSIGGKVVIHGNDRGAPLSEQTISQALASAREHLARSLLN